MKLVDQCRNRKIHTRNIQISTYEHDEKHIVVEGILKDDLLIPIYVSGKEKQPHSPHHMIIQLLIECLSLVIKDINVEMPIIPYEWCIETSDSLDSIIGLKIEPGFTSKVKKILRESKRCLHLTTLLFAIVPTVMQGYWTYNARKPGSGDVPSEIIDHYLVDTCWVWRKGGPRVKMLNSSKAQEEMSKIYSKVGYCNCGYEIWIEFLPSGFKWIYRFFDMDHNEITECPVCGNKLDEEDLESM